MGTFAELFAKIAAETPEPVDDEPEPPQCAYCRRFAEVGADGLCDDCRRDYKRGYRASYLAGRCANGAERDGGTRYHAVPMAGYRALCGTEPGRRSAGWGTNWVGEVTCPRCLARLKKRGG